MADVFISYARKDLTVARRIKALLEAEGLSVYLDVDRLDGGTEFPDALDREVKGAGAVLGLWTAWSLSRRWVKIECRIGLDRGKLVPALIESIDPQDIPAAFYDVQTVDLSRLDEKDGEDAWRTLLRSIARILKRPALATGGAVGAALHAQQAGPAEKRDSNTKRVLQRVVVGTALILGAAALGVWAFGAFSKPQAKGEPSSSPLSPAADEAAVDPCAMQPESFQVYFEWDRLDLASHNLDTVTAALNRAVEGGCEITRVRISGHGDSSEPPSVVEKLSERRAMAVAAVVQQWGVPAGNIEAFGRGSRDPAEPRPEGTREPLNRRAEVMISVGKPTLAEKLARLELDVPDVDYQAAIHDILATATIVELEQTASNSAPAALLMGWAYANALVVKQDRKTAAVYFGKACDGGLLRGCTELAWSQTQGHTGSNRSQGVKSLENLCRDRSYGFACWLAGQEGYGAGDGPTPARALSYLEKACALNFVTGCADAIDHYEVHPPVNAAQVARLKDLKSKACELGKRCDSPGAQ